MNPAAADYENLSDEHLASTLEALRKQLTGTGSPKNEETYRQVVLVAKILFDRQPADALAQARASVSDVLTRKDELLLRESEFEKMTPVTIAKWRQEKYGGRTSIF